MRNRLAYQKIVRLPRWSLSRRHSTRRRATRRANSEHLESRELLAADLVGQWRADDLVGVVAADETVSAWTDSVAGIAASGSNGPTFDAVSYGGRAALQFGATDTSKGLRIRTRDNPMTGAADFTVLVSFATTSTDLLGGQGEWFENTGLVDSNSRGFTSDWGITINAAGQVSAGLGIGFNANPVNVFSSATGLNDGQLHTAVLVRSGSNLSLYVDDGAADVLSDSPTANLASNNIGIGQLSGQTNVFPGDIAEVRMYGSAMDASEVASTIAEVTSFYDNQLPVPTADEYFINEDFAILFVSANQGVLANDTDADGDPLTAQLVDASDNGTVSLNADGSFIYAVDKNYFGTDTFTYVARDFRDSDPVTVTINVAPVYDPVAPSDDSYQALPSEPMVIDVTEGVLKNDINVDQAALTVTLIDDVGSGALTLNADGSFTYDPEGFAGTTSFTYEVDDGTQLVGPATVTLVLNTPPQTQNDQYDITEDTDTSIAAALGVLANDIDADGDTLTASIVSPTTQGTIELNEDGSFRYVPNADFFGPDSFSYVISDGVDTSAETVVQLNVVSVNDAAVAQDDAFVMLPGSTLDVPTDRGLLANDSDVDGPALQASLLDGPSNGTLQLRADGSFTYTPNAGFNGIDLFRYTANDTLSDSIAATVTVRVDPNPVIISEIMAANRDLLVSRTRESVDDDFARNTEKTFDWIELRNPFATTLAIGGFYLTDDAGDLTKWQIPAGTTIPADGYLVFFASGRNITDPALDELGILHTNFSLRVEGEYLAVTSTGGQVLNQLGDYPRQEPLISFGVTDAGEFAYFVTPTPGLANTATYDGVVADTTFSVERGFFTDPFQVAMVNETPGAEIRYTTDGSDPTAATGQAYSGPVDVTTTTTLRAAAFLDGSVSSRTTTNTYIFINDVITQGNSPEGYPDQWGLGGPSTAPWEPRPADYEMDPEITQDPAYRDLIDDALLAIPTISIVTSIENLFDPQTGIYQNTQGHGVEWERPASIEMINPDGTLGFQIDAGIRIQGGASREPWKNPKHGFRLKFKGIYGSEKLKFDWFGGDATDEFDEIVLRAGANQAWLHHNQFLGDNRGRAQYIRDQWVNDTYRAMGRPAANADYAHLYINGIYWGLYNPKERPTDGFLASYLGGDKKDFDVLNAGTLLSGTNDAWRELNDRKWRGLDDPATYEEFSKLLDIDAYIDYMVMNQYGGNLDWDSHNWYAVRSREPGGKFMFSPWDGEFVFINSNDNVLRKTEAAPGQIFRNLQKNPEFVMRLADRIQKHYFNDGVLTTENVVDRWNARSDQIELAIIGESARWGDYRRDVDNNVAGPFVLLERDVQWMAERERLLTEYFPVRGDNVLAQYRQLSLFPSIDAPAFNQRGGNVPDNFAVDLSVADGTIYYTTDGSDPRLPGGGIRDTAVPYSGSIQLDRPTTIRTRALKDGEWSTIDQAEFVTGVVPVDASNFRVSEINYNPGDSSDAEVAAGHTNNDDFEFIELLNISDQRIDLSNVRFQQVDVNGDPNDSQGVNFEFSTGAIKYLEPGQYVLVVEDTEAFGFRYGDSLAVAGQWSGRLSNNSEQVTLTAGETIIQQFTYADDWYSETDNNGMTLEIVDASDSELANWGLKSGWRASRQVGGSPGSDLGGPIAGDSNRDGIFDSNDLIFVLQAGEYEDGIPNNSTFEEGDWDGDGDFGTQDFIFALQAGTYVGGVPAVSQSTNRIAAALANDNAWSDRPLRRTSQNDLPDGVTPSQDRLTIDPIATRAIESIFADRSTTSVRHDDVEFDALEALSLLEP